MLFVQGAKDAFGTPEDSIAFSDIIRLMDNGFARELALGDRRAARRRSP